MRMICRRIISIISVVVLLFCSAAAVDITAFAKDTAQDAVEYNGAYYTPEDIVDIYVKNKSKWLYSSYDISFFGFVDFNGDGIYELVRQSHTGVGNASRHNYNSYYGVDPEKGTLYEIASQEAKDSGFAYSLRMCRNKETRRISYYNSRVLGGWQELTTTKAMVYMNDGKVTYDIVSENVQLTIIQNGSSTVQNVYGFVDDGNMTIVTEKENAEKEKAFLEKYVDLNATFVFRSDEELKSSSDVTFKKNILNLYNSFTYDRISFEIMSGVPGFDYSVGDDVLLGAYHICGEKIDDTTKYAVSVSDASVLSYQKNQVTGGIASFWFKAKKTGYVTVTFTEVKSGEKKVISFEVKSKKNGLRCTDVTSDHYVKGDGLYLDNVKCTDINDKTSDITFDIYNSFYTYGIVEVYDKFGNYVTSEAIAPRADSSGVKMIVDSLKCIGYDLFEENYVFYRDPGYTAKTTVKLKDIPHSSKIQFTLNSAASERLVYLNAIDIYVTCLLEASSVSVEETEKVKTVVQFAKRVAASLPDSMYKELMSKINTSVAVTGISEKTSSIYEAVKTVLVNAGVDVKAVLSDILFSVGFAAADTAIETIIPSWKIVQIVGAVTAIGWKLNDLEWCLGKKTSCIYSSSHSATVDQLVSNSVVAEKDGGFENEVLDVEIYNGIININLDSGEIVNTVPYEINMYKNGDEYDPDSKIKVMVPVPDGYDAENCGILRQEENGSYTMLNTVTDGEYLIFETEHFSLYILFEAENIEDIKLGEPFITGDVNLDGQITAADARLALRASVRLETLSDIQLLAADVDGKAGITAADARLILRASVGLEKL